MSQCVRKASCAALGVLFLLVAAGCQPTGSFQYIPGPDSTATPYTKAPAASEAPLRFAIMADRTGGARAGVFEDGVRKVNLLQPDIVLCVGDLIEGYSDDAPAIHRMWDQFEGLVSPLSAPFFHVRGNHDALRAELDNVWRQRVGPRYYAFVYRDCLFLCLNSLDGGFSNSQWQPGISQAQFQWVRKALADHPSVRWTFLFMHYPLWVNDEEAVADAKPGAAPKLTGFAALEDALAGRDYTFFTGHFHDYAKYLRRGHEYYILATTGGSSSLRGPSAGEFDEIVWVSMTPKGPQVANLELKGILPSDVRTEGHARLQYDLGRWKVAKMETNPLRLTLTMEMTNPYAKPAAVSVAWKAPEGSGWTVTPPTAALQIEPNQTGKSACVATFGDPVSELTVAPSCDVQFLIPGEEPLKRASNALAFGLQDAFVQNRPTITCVKAAAPPQCDGKLDDAVWNRSADVPRFTDWKLARKPLAATEARLAYDGNNLYVAFRCQEPNIALLRANAKGPEGVWRDDCVEVMVGGADRKMYHQFGVSVTGLFAHAKGGEAAAADASSGAGFVAATSKEAGGWIAEMVIPWKGVGLSPKSGDHVTVLLGRQRPQIWEVVQWPSSPAGNARPEAFAEVILGE